RIAVAALDSMLRQDSVYSVVAERDGRIVGSNFLHESPAVSGIGPITVDPAEQDGTVGRRLMDDVLARAADQRTPSVRLVQAAYHARSLSLYTKLGFESREPLAVLQGAAPSTDGLPSVRRARRGDAGACNRLCVEVHGHDRAGEVDTSIAGDHVLVVESDGEVTGYTTGVGF